MNQEELPGSRKMIANIENQSSDNTASSHDAHSPASILRLSNEILLLIIGFAAWKSERKADVWYLIYKPAGFNPFQRTNSALLALSTCCKRLNALVEPFLYGSIFRDSSGFYPRGPEKSLLYRTLKENSSLGSLCKQLYLDGAYAFKVEPGRDSRRDGPIENVANTYNLLKLLFNVEDITLKYDSTSGPWSYQFCKVATAMRNVRKLRIHLKKDRRYCTAAMLVQNLGGLLQLEFLSISGLSKGTQDSNPLSKNTVLPEIMKGTAPIKVLQICNVLCHPYELDQLLAWPVALEDLTLGTSGPPAHCHNFYQWLDYEMDKLYTTPVLMEIISKQKDSLRALEFLTLRGKYHALYGTQSQEEHHNFQAFRQLEKIRLSWQSLPRDPWEAVQGLCGPKVKSLVFDFYSPTRTQAGWFPFDEDALEYIETLVSCAQNAGARLQSIEVVWFTEYLHLIIDLLEAGLDVNDYICTDIDEQCDIRNNYKSYELLNRLRKTLTSRGVSLSYTAQMMLMENYFN